MVCSSWTWSFTLIIFNRGPNSCLGCCGGFSSGAKPFPNRPFSEDTLHFSLDLEFFLFPRVSFSSLDPTNSGILCNTALIHTYHDFKCKTRSSFLRSIPATRTRKPKKTEDVTRLGEGPNNLIPRESRLLTLENGGRPRGESQHLWLPGSRCRPKKRRFKECTVRSLEKISS